MFYASIDDEAISGARLEDLASYIDTNGTADHVHKLVVRMTVARANPICIEEVPDKHELIRVRQNLTAHAGLWSKGLWFFIANEAHAALLLPVY